MAAVLAAAFASDPVLTWMLPGDPQARERRLVRFFGQECRRSRAAGGAWTTADGSAAAVWFPPGRWRAGRLEALRHVPTALRVFRRGIGRAGSALAVMQRHHPAEPHWYLYYLATEPHRQGGGLGTLLLAPVLDECDRTRVPAYLEATGERNRALYARHGFRDLDRLPLPAGGPTLFPMWRDPR